MLMSTREIPALELLAPPSLDGLSEQQVRGITCVWGGETLSAATAVDLGVREGRRVGQPFSWYPRACRDCVQREALRTLHVHAPTCTQCVHDAARCETGVALRRLMRHYRR